MPQDDSKQWEHLLRQENDPSWSDPAHLNLHSISLRSRSISATSSTRSSYQKRQLGPRKLTSTKMDDLGLYSHLLEQDNTPACFLTYRNYFERKKLRGGPPNPVMVCVIKVGSSIQGLEYHFQHPGTSSTHTSKYGIHVEVTVL